MRRSSARRVAALKPVVILHREAGVQSVNTHRIPVNLTKYCRRPRDGTSVRDPVGDVKTPAMVR